MIQLPSATFISKAVASYWDWRREETRVLDMDNLRVDGQEALVLDMDNLRVDGQETLVLDLDNLYIGGQSSRSRLRYQKAD
jgi:hypothetical protein